MANGALPITLEILPACRAPTMLSAKPLVLL